MSKSAQIRELAAQGVGTAEIARRLGIRYQFAYGVLARVNQLPSSARQAKPPTAVKPELTAERLLAGGFVLAASWVSDAEGGIALNKPLPKEAGVYAFVIEGRAHYVGLASMGLSRRAYFYARPSATQRTSLRLNGMLIEHAAAGTEVQIYVATPPDGEWNDLPVDYCAGLELGLIRCFSLPWNKRSAG